MKKLLLALLALISTQAALAAGNKPPDVPAFVQQTVSYAAGSATNTLGTGTPPAYASMPANIPTSPTTGMLYTGTGDYVAPDNFHAGKFRTEANSNHVFADDCIRNYGQPGTSHFHQYYGNMVANAYCTYASLRAKCASTSAGNCINASAYWFPCSTKTNPFADGKNYCVKADHETFYYFGYQPPDPNNQVYFPRGGRMVFGTNMDDPDDLVVKAEIATANAQTGTAGRYAYVSNGFDGWICASTGESKPYLANLDGTQAFATTCPSTSQLYAQVNSAPCWDGVNLWSPTGYAHFRQEIRNVPTGKLVCPIGWFRVFQIQLKVLYTHSGGNDYKTWRLSSDNAAGTAAGRSLENGGSFHTDYVMAWDDAILRTTEDFCNGVNGSTGNECNFSTLTATTLLQVQTNASAGFTYGTASAANMYLLPSATYTGSRTHATH